MEILNLLHSPAGKALHLDLASFQKTRGSAVKIKMKIDLTTVRSHHVWLRFYENKYVNGDKI